MSSHDQFNDRVFWVTGAFGALGAAVVRRLAYAGAHVVASSRNIDNHFPGSSVNAALDLLVQGLGRKYGPHAVRVNAVAPGPIESPRFASMTTAQAHAEPTRLTALDGPGTPDDVAAAVTYLLSDDARFVTGTRLYVDGGGPPYA